MANLIIAHLVLYNPKPLCYIVQQSCHKCLRVLCCSAALLNPVSVFVLCTTRKQWLCGITVPCTGVMEVCARRMWCSVMWYAGWCWAISTLVHTLLSPWRKKEKEHERCSLGTEEGKQFKSWDRRWTEAVQGCGSVHHYCVFTESWSWKDANRSLWVSACTQHLKKNKSKCNVSLLCKTDTALRVELKWREMFNFRLNKPMNQFHWETNVQRAGLSGSCVTDDECFSPNSSLENMLKMCLCKSLALIFFIISHTGVLLQV